MSGWFKGMEVIIQECGLWPAEGLNAQCEGFKCEPGCTNCCCCCLLFTQPNFMAQKSQLEEFVASWGHICDFYPKYHCELNVIEQYWGALKLCYCSLPCTTNLKEMGKKCPGLPWWCAIVADMMVCFHLLHYVLILISCFAAMPIDQHASFWHMHRACQAHKQCGPIGSIMDITHYHLILLLLSSNLFICNSYSKSELP